MPSDDQPAQLDLFPPAPVAPRTRGRGVSGELADYLDAARAKGCTHVEVSKDGMLLVIPSLVGRDPAASYLPLSDIQVRKAIASAKGRTCTRLRRLAA